jgi:formate C-acetyltransferase
MQKVTLKDISLRDYELTERAAYLKKAYFRALPEICIERPQLITGYSLDNALLNQNRISILDKAKTYRHVLENRAPVIRFRKAYEKGMEPFELEDSSLFAGSTTSKFKGVPLYPEFLALTMWPELWSMSKRESNPYYISDNEVEALNHEIFPHWMENNITELARKRCFEENFKKDERNKKHAPEMKLLERLVFFITTKLNCISHTIPDFNRVIKSGLREVINDAKKRGDNTTDESEKEFYAAISEAMEGIIAYSRRLAAEAEKLANGENDPVRKKELLDIAEVNRQVPEFPARTFREGLTAVWICWVAAHLENPNIGLSLGRLDQVLYDLYRKDIENKTIDISEAIELLCCLWLKIGDHVPMVPEAAEQLYGGSGSNQAITIGGVDKDGKDAVNDLTYVMLRATELMRLRDPNLNARYHSGVNSEEYLKRICEVNITTGATPALHNDKAVIKTLLEKGETVEQARDYGAIGCVEPGSNGRFYGHTGAIMLNLTSALELALFNGRHRHTGMDLIISKETGGPDSFKTFDDFKAAFEEQSLWLVEQSTNLNNILGKVHQDFYPTPVLSALFEGPMEKGKDLIQGGAVINSSGAAIIGLADVADSLSAIQKNVFNDGTVTLPELINAIKKDFKGHEELHMRLVSKSPKYGNEDQLADNNVSNIMKMLDKAFGEKQNYRGGGYRVGYWTMTNHAGFGRLMGAFPNGRKAHENFTSGITPVSGVTPELTPALNSIANLPVECSSNGMALNLKYTPENGDNSRMLKNFVETVEGYFDDNCGQRTGGMEIQFNITTHDKFVDAVKHPENYPELLVRVSGYTAYFRDLNPQMQKEIIDRTEYLLSTGKAVNFEPFPLPERK